MAAILRSGLAGGLRMVLNGYGLRPQYYVRSFCKAPPDDAKSNVTAPLIEKKGEQTEGNSPATLRVEETEERLEAKKDDSKVDGREEMVSEIAAQEIEASSLEGKQTEEDVLRDKPEVVPKVEDLGAKEQETVERVEDLVAKEQEAIQKVEDLVAKEKEAVQKVEDLVVKQQEAIQEVKSLQKEEQETVQKVEELVCKEYEAVQNGKDLAVKEQETAQEVELIMKEEQETVQEVERLVKEEQVAVEEVEKHIKEEQVTVQEEKRLIKEQETIQEIESFAKQEQEMGDRQYQPDKAVAAQNVVESTGQTAAAQEVEGPPAEEQKSETPKDEKSEEVKVAAEEGQETTQVEGAVEDKKVAAQNKLNDLLTSLATTDPMPVEPLVKLSRPKARRQKKVQSEPVDVATPTPEESIEPELLSAAEEVAKDLGGDVEGTKLELLSALRSHSPDVNDKPTVSLSELFVGMKVEKSTSKPVKVKEYPRKRFVQDSEAKHKGLRGDEQKMWSKAPSIPMPRTLARVDLFGAEPLGIFTKSGDGVAASASRLKVWEAAHKREQQLCVAHPPENAFIEMIQWTNRGILWTFPIDNEFGLEEEKKVGFHEHVFLERHLEGWCPRRGPIRHFMELVCTGLSKNPYLTVQRKRAHIEWYKNYFAEKEDVLREIGAIESSEAN